MQTARPQNLPKEEQVHLDLLVAQIDASSSPMNFSQGVMVYGYPPSDTTYRAAIRYAHVRYLRVCSYVIWLRESIRKMRRQKLLNKAKAEGTAVKMSALAELKMGSKVQGVPKLRIGDEEWIEANKKGVLQNEIVRAVDARRLLEAERDQLLPLSEEAAVAERASRM